MNKQNPPQEARSSTCPVPVAYTMVSSNAALAEHCTRWQQCPALALDTEFIRTSTFYPKVGLIQLSDGQSTWLIDPLMIDDWTPFTTLMTDPAVCKVFHSCSEDLLVFIAFIGVLPEPLYDTQIAAAFLGVGLSFSYQNLVLQMRGVELPKGETRSDWLQRPLTQDQLDYAALDVVYLLSIADEQKAALTAAGKLAWVEEECQRALNSHQREFSRDFSEHYQNIRTAWQLKPRSLLALKLLADWRETRARERDKPRNWIVRDPELHNIAAAMPQNLSELGQIEGLSPSFIRYEGDTVLALVASAAEADPASYPDIPDKPLTPGQKKLFKTLKAAAERVAVQAGVPVELLARKRLLVELVQAVRVAREKGGDAWQAQLLLPQELSGWRQDLLHDALLEAIDSHE